MTRIADVISEVVNETHVPMVTRAFGEAGTTAIFEIMDVLKRLYAHLEPERVTGRVVVFQRIGPVGQQSYGRPEPPVDFADFAGTRVTDLVLEVVSAKVVYDRSAMSDGAEQLSATAVVYVYQAGTEHFLAKYEKREVIRLDTIARSQFCVPTLADLRQALQQYARTNVRESSCLVFQRVWRDANRLFFRTKPERTMRRSLVQFLRNRLGADYDVWPEQNVDESHPVDIRVHRSGSNRLMLIEIKWLGASAKKSGRITVRYGPSRARSGAKQLIQYLERQRQFAPSSVIHAYYVIVDGRRRKLQRGAVTTDSANGLYYENRDVTFDPEPHVARHDFDRPYRMFARPKLA